VDDHVADLAGAEFLRFGWKTQECIDLSLDEKLFRLDRWSGNPVYVLDGVEPDIGGHAGEEQVRTRAQDLHAHASALQIRDAANALASEQLEAADMDAGQHFDRFARVHRDDERRGEIQT